MLTSISNFVGYYCQSHTSRRTAGVLFYPLLWWYEGPYLHHHHHHHHHRVMPLARISLTLYRHFSLSFIASGRSSRLRPVSSHSCCMYVRAAFAHPYAGVHRSTSLMSSSLLLQQCPVCLVCLTLIIFVIGGRWPYRWCLVGCCCQDLFNIGHNLQVNVLV